MKGVFKVLGAVVKAATPIVLTAVQPESLVNVVLGGVLKHKTGLNNQDIPVANMIGSTVFSYVKLGLGTGDWVGSIVPAVQQGGLLAGGSWALHQSLKVPAAELITDPVLATKVGPGSKFSL